MPQLGTHAALYSAPSLVVPLFNSFLVVLHKAEHHKITFVTMKNSWRDLIGPVLQVEIVTSNQRSHINKSKYVYHALIQTIEPRERHRA